MKLKFQTNRQDKTNMPYDSYVFQIASFYPSIIFEMGSTTRNVKTRGLNEHFIIGVYGTESERTGV